MSMGDEFRQEMKFLYLAQMLRRKTDEEHPAGLGSIAAYLKELGITEDEANLKKDLEILREYGLDITVSEEEEPLYCLRNREFYPEEIRVLMDMVQSSGIITKRRREALIEKIGKLTSAYKEEEIKRQVMASDARGRDSLYQSMNTVYRAMDEDYEISFLYYEWILTEDRKLKRKGERLTLSPWGILHRDEYYYLIAIDGKSGVVKNYRLDRMRDVMTEPEKKRAGHDFFSEVDVADFAAAAFGGVFCGKEEEVSLEFENRLLGKAVDTFGEELVVTEKGEKSFTVCVKVPADREFFGWLAGAGTGVKIVGPENVLTEYKKFLRKALGNYNR
mgnify:FL=1